MGKFKEFNERGKRFCLLDIKLLQFAGIFVGLILVKLIPDIMNISIWWLVVGAVIFGIRPLAIFFQKTPSDKESV